MAGVFGYHNDWRGPWWHLVAGTRDLRDPALCSTVLSNKHFKLHHGQSLLVSCLEDEASQQFSGTKINGITACGGSGHSLTGVKNLLTTLGLLGPTEVLHAKYFPFRPRKGFSKDALMLVYCKFGLHL